MKILIYVKNHFPISWDANFEKLCQWKTIATVTDLCQIDRQWQTQRMVPMLATATENDVYNGLIGGFATITAGCYVVDPWAAIIFDSTFAGQLDLEEEYGLVELFHHWLFYATYLSLSFCIFLPASRLTNIRAFKNHH